MAQTKSDMTKDLGYGWNVFLRHLVEIGEISEKERTMFLDYFFYYSLGKDMKYLTETYGIKSADLKRRMDEISKLVQKTSKDLYQSAIKFNVFEEKLRTLKFQQMHKMVFADGLFTGMNDANFLHKLGIKTVTDLLTKPLNPRKTKSAEKENARLLRITQDIINKIGI